MSKPPDLVQGTLDLLLLKILALVGLGKLLAGEMPRYPEIDCVHAVARKTFENGSPVRRSILGFLRPDGQRVGSPAAHLR